MVDKSEKEANFKKIAPNRVNNIIKHLTYLGNTSNTSHYSYTSHEVDQMFRAIKKEMDTQKSRFNKGKTSNKSFKFD